jgi:hypothetical protein
MELSENEVQEIQQKIYQFIVNALVNEKKANYEVVKELVEMGISETTANEIVDEIEFQIQTEKVKRGKRDMLFGALWCIGGTLLTLSNIGYVFWGAIVFGAYQFIRGAVNSQR